MLTMLSVILLIGLANRGSSTITSDQGYFKDFNPTNCINGASFLKIVPFSGTFANVPQIIINPIKYDMSSTINNEFKFSITSTTTTQFTTKIVCAQNHYVYRFWFKWTAIDDYRIEVISSFNRNVNYATSQTYTLPHYNPNVLQGFPNAISISFIGALTFSLAVQTITSTEVTVLYTSNGKLFQFGFQVILGTAEAFTQSSLFTQTSITQYSYFSSGILTIPTGCLFVIPLVAIDLPLNQNIRVVMNETDTTTTVSYQYGVWDISSCNSLTHQQVWLSAENSKTLTPIFLKKMRASLIFDQNIAFKSSSQLYIAELSLTMKWPISSNAVKMIDKTMLTLNFEAQLKCNANKKLTSSFQRCTSCSQQNQLFQQNCFGNMNLITLYFQFQQQDSVYQSLSISVTSSGFTLTKKVYNRALETYVIGSVSMVDI